jgi:hypothetical protein
MNKPLTTSQLEQLPLHIQGIIRNEISDNMMRDIRGNYCPTLAESPDFLPKVLRIIELWPIGENEAPFNQIKINVIEGKHYVLPTDDWAIVFVVGICHGIAIQRALTGDAIGKV